MLYKTNWEHKIRSPVLNREEKWTGFVLDTVRVWRSYKQGGESRIVLRSGYTTKEWRNWLVTWRAKLPILRRLT